MKADLKARDSLIIDTLFSTRPDSAQRITTLIVEQEIQVLRFINSRVIKPYWKTFHQSPRRIIRIYPIKKHRLEIRKINILKMKLQVLKKMMNRALSILHRLRKIRRHRSSHRRIMMSIWTKQRRRSLRR